MCFTPWISLSTAVLEWMLAGVMFFSFKRSKLAPLFALLLVFLGLYQFSEFMLCTTRNTFWVLFGFLAYTFLPAIGLHGVCSYVRLRVQPLLLYFIPVAYLTLAVLFRDFVYVGECHTFFVQTKTILSLSSWLAVPYSLYYCGFIILMAVILLTKILETRDLLQKKIYGIEFLALLFMALPTFILIFVFPTLGAMFPSVLCHFAIFVAIFSFIGAWLDIRLQKKKRK